MFKYLILGIVQGVTEFLPVSSSGHLVLLENFFGISENQVAITVVLHLGTVFSLLVFFFKDLLGLLKDRKLLGLIVVTTAITAAIGFAGKDYFEKMFSSPKQLAFEFLITAVILIMSKSFMNGKRQAFNLKDSVILGLTQSIAIIPAISRSGITICTLLFRGLSPKESFRISFLGAIPVIFGASLLEAKEINFALQADFRNLIFGFLVSFAVGLISLKLLKQVLKQAKLYYFGYYCIIIALVTLIFVK